MKTGIVGASGYAGGELLRLLSNHDDFEITYVSAGTSAGELITSVHPHLVSFEGQRFSATEIAEINKCDLVFLALPHGESASLVAQISQSVKIVDLGADFRLASSNSWLSFYGGAHAGQLQYGLPEIGSNKEAIGKSSRVANPGCYATAIILGCAPAVALGLIDSSDLVAVAASGTTGAGRSAKVGLIASEVVNNLTSYKFGGVHQHIPEIEENLELLAHSNLATTKLSFTPILAPMPRGILATITAKLVKPSNIEEIRRMYGSYYAKSEFVKLLPVGQMPQTSATIGSNFAIMQIVIDDHTERLVISIAIDNLGKGAAGQAIQNANLMCGFPEDRGLPSSGVR